MNNNFMYMYIATGVELIIPASIEIPEGEVRQLCVDISNGNMFTDIQRNIELYISVTHSKHLQESKKGACMKYSVINIDEVCFNDMLWSSVGKDSLLSELVNIV